jgi:hypothetical protein
MMNMLIFKMSVNLTDEVPVDKEKNDWKRNEMDIRKKEKRTKKWKTCQREQNWNRHSKYHNAIIGNARSKKRRKEEN